MTTEELSLGESRWFDFDYSNFFCGSGDDVLNMVGPFKSWYDRALNAGYYLYSEPLHTEPATEVVVRDRKTGALLSLINLASYNYLGISYRPEVKAAAARAIERYGLGAAGSPILSGTFDIHNELAKQLALFKGKEAAILFPTGYSANVGFLSGLMRPGDTILLDQYAHASAVDGAILSKATTRYFRHNNAEDLDRKLAKCVGKKLVVVEGVYSMDGDLCPLPEIVPVCQKHNARILIDEAHSAFLYGKHGRGVAEHFGLDDSIDFHMGTFSKSLGGQGGYICGSQPLIDYLNGFGRSRFFSCNLSPVLVAGLLAGLEIAKHEPQLRNSLWKNVEFLRNALQAEGVNCGDSRSQIIPIMVNNDAKVFAVAEGIQQRGLFLQPVTYPAVPKNKSRLRVSVSAAHTEQQLSTSAAVIAHVLRDHESLA